jgi:hypothetical protein
VRRETTAFFNENENISAPTAGRIAQDEWDENSGEIVCAGWGGEVRCGSFAYTGDLGRREDLYPFILLGSYNAFFQWEAHRQWKQGRALAFWEPDAWRRRWRGAGSPPAL